MSNLLVGVAIIALLLILHMVLLLREDRIQIEVLRRRVDALELLSHYTRNATAKDAGIDAICDQIWGE